MLLQREEVLQVLIHRNLLDAGLKIIDRSRFEQLLLAIFLSCISHERVKFFWKSDYLEDMNYRDKHNKIINYFNLPFHFVGFGDKTVFISDKHFKDKIFNEEFIPEIIGSYNDIHFFRKISNLIEITNDKIYSNHECERRDGEFCQKCKPGFLKELIKNHELFFKSLNVKSYAVLDVPISLIMEFISEDDLIEESEQNKCEECGKLILPNFKYCPECSKEVSKKEKYDTPNREKVFNELLSIYLGLNNAVQSYKANLPIHKSTQETDVLLQHEDKSLLIEGTTQINLPKEYIIKKAILLLVIDSLPPFRKKRNCLILWSLDKDCNSSINKDLIRDMFEDSDKFIFLKSNLLNQILNGPEICIKQPELDQLSSEFAHILSSLNFLSKKYLEL